jgi:hypothetical protein
LFFVDLVKATASRSHKHLLTEGSHGWTACETVQ